MIRILINHLKFNNDTKRLFPKYMKNKTKTLWPPSKACYNAITSFLVRIFSQDADVEERR